MSVKITVNNNGSLRVEGEVKLRDQQGDEFDLGNRQVFSLCRCGHSKKKPFCDGSHRDAKFQSEVRAFTL